MKIMVAVVLLSIVMATNAQMLNGQNQIVKLNSTLQTTGDTGSKFSLFTKEELSKISSTGFSDEKTDYLQKSRNQKTAAWVLAGGGGAILIAGIIVAGSNATSDYVNLFSLEPVKERNTTLETTLIITGGVAVLSSITLFIASSKNKRKAAGLSISNQKTGSGAVPSYESNSITGITLSMPLGK